MNESSTRIRAQQREARWRKLIARQAGSGRSVAAFCRDESIAVQTFYWWRARLGKREGQPRVACGAAPFLDLGTMADLGGSDAAGGPGAGIEVRLELPGGVTLTIARR